MHKFEIWLIGFTCVVLSEYDSRIFVVSQDADCPIYGVHELAENVKGAECSNMNLREVPQNLPTNIVAIKLNNNPSLNLRNHSFAKFPKLWLIEVNYMSKIPGQSEPEISVSTFQPLKNLQFLFMIHSWYTRNFVWPASIETLVMDETNITNLDITGIQKLSVLSLSATGLRDVPAIHQLAPLTSFRAQSNPLDVLSAESIARYCLLENLVLDVTLISPTSSNFCRCSRLEKWVSMQNITLDGTIECDKPSDPITCSSDFAEAIDERDTCLINHGKLEPSYIYRIMLIGGVLLIGSMLLVISFLTYRYFYKKSETSEPEVPSEEAVEEEVAEEDEEE